MTDARRIPHGRVCLDRRCQSLPNNTPLSNPLFKNHTIRMPTRPLELLVSIRILLNQRLLLNKPLSCDQTLGGPMAKDCEAIPQHPQTKWPSFQMRRNNDNPLSDDLEESRGPVPSRRSSGSWESFGSRIRCEHSAKSQCIR